MLKHLDRNVARICNSDMDAQGDQPPGSVPPEVVEWILNNEFRRQPFVVGQEGNGDLPGFVAEADGFLLGDKLAIVVIFDTNDDQPIANARLRVISCIALGRRDVDLDQCLWAYDDRRSSATAENRAIYLFRINATGLNAQMKPVGVMARIMFYSMLGIEAP